MQRTNASGHVIRTYRYDAFGNQLSPDGRQEEFVYPRADNNPFRFGGMYWDWERGEYMTPHRMLNPRTGRWSQPDPFWNIHNMQFGRSPTMRNGRNVPSIHAILQSGNLHMFVMHNPVMFTDPSGLFAIRASRMFMFASSSQHKDNPSYCRTIGEKGGGASSPAVGSGPGGMRTPDEIGDMHDAHQAARNANRGSNQAAGTRFSMAAIRTQTTTANTRRAHVNTTHGQWVNVNESMSRASRNFQTQITGRTGQAFQVNGVRFDGVSSSGRLIEVKGGFSNFVNQSTGQFHSWFRGAGSLVDQANRQIQAAGGVPIDWFFSDITSMNAVKSLFESENITEINLIFQAPR